MQFQTLEDTCSILHLHDVDYDDIDDLTQGWLRNKYFNWLINSPYIRNSYKHAIYFSNHHYNFFERLYRKIKLEGTYKGHCDKKVYIYTIRLKD